MTSSAMPPSRPQPGDWRSGGRWLAQMVGADGGAKAVGKDGWRRRRGYVRPRLMASRRVPSRNLEGKLGGTKIARAVSWRSGLKPAGRKMI